jgi:hypothetical protein
LEKLFNESINFDFSKNILLNKKAFDHKKKPIKAKKFDKILYIYQTKIKILLFM